MQSIIQRLLGVYTAEDKAVLPQEVSKFLFPAVTDQAKRSQKALVETYVLKKNH